MSMISDEQFQILRKNLSELEADIWDTPPTLCGQLDPPFEMKQRTLTPIGLAVLVRRDPPKVKIGSIWLPESSEEYTEGQFATVLALGTGVDDEGKPVEGRFNVKPGDRVCLYEHGGSKVKKKFASGDEYTYVVQHDDIQGLVDEWDSIRNGYYTERCGFELLLQSMRAFEWSLSINGRQHAYIKDLGMTHEDAIRFANLEFAKAHPHLHQLAQS